MAPLRTRHVREVHGLTAVGKKSKGQKQSRKQQLAEQLVVEQQRTADVLETLSTSVSAQQSSSGDRLLEEIRKLGMKPLAEARPEIEDRLRKAQADRLTSQYMETLRNAAVVEKKI